MPFDSLPHSENCDNLKGFVAKPCNDITKRLLVRSCEIPVQNSVESRGACDSKLESTCKVNHEYSKPGLCTSMKTSESLKKIKSTVSNLGKERDMKRVGRPQQTVVHKAAKKINIPFDEEVYKDLINLKVDDEDVGLQRGGFPVRSRELSRPREPEPALADFYSPRFNKEFVVKSAPPVYQVEKVWKYNGYGVTDAMKKWEPVLL